MPCPRANAKVALPPFMSPEQPHQSAPKPLFIKARDTIEQNPAVHAVLQTIGTYIHANHISASRALGVIAAVCLDPVSRAASVATYAVTTGVDWLDGAVARSTDGGETREGAILDTFIDKIGNAIALSHIVSQHMEHVWFSAAAALSVSLNVISQAQRGPTQLKDIARGIFSPERCEKVENGKGVNGIRANVFGKIKMIIESAAILGMFAAGDDPMMQGAATLALTASSALCVIGTRKRMHVKREKEIA